MKKISPTVYVLIGLPASGKSTWREKFVKDYPVVSTDKFIEDSTEFVDITNNTIFNIAIKSAKKAMNLELKQLIANAESFVIDRTNLSKNSRRIIMAQIPKSYTKIAVLFSVDEEVRHQRAMERLQKSGKFINDAIINNMRDRFESPTLDEGFKEIIIVKD